MGQITHSFLHLNAQGQPDSTVNVELWTGKETVPYWQAPKIGDFTNHGNGQYSIVLSAKVVGTILIDGSLRNDADKNIIFPSDVVDGSEINDNSITPQKTTFLY